MVHDLKMKSKDLQERGVYDVQCKIANDGIFSRKQAVYTQIALQVARRQGRGFKESHDPEVWSVKQCFSEQNFMCLFFFGIPEPCCLLRSKSELYSIVKKTVFTLFTSYYQKFNLSHMIVTLQSYFFMNSYVKSVSFTNETSTQVLLKLNDQYEAATEDRLLSRLCPDLMSNCFCFSYFYSSSSSNSTTPPDNS